MTTFLRNLGHDLVDKKLWPLVVALALAVVAVPVLLGGGGDEPTPGDVASTSTPTQPPGTSTGQEIAVAAEPPTVERGAGKVRDPFKQQYEPVDTTATIVAPGTAGTGGTTAPSTKPSTGTTTPGAPTTTPPATSRDPLDVYRVALRFGQPGGQRTIRDIARLSPLPNADRPFFVFLGVLSGGKKAVFLVSSDATATGDGTCRPSKTNCETVEMAAGRTEFFDLETENGTVQYQLDLLSIKRRDGVPVVSAGSGATAARRGSTAEKQGAELEADDLGTDAYGWDERGGVLVRRSETASRVSMNVAGGLVSALRAASAEFADLADGGWHPDPEFVPVPTAP